MDGPGEIRPNYWQWASDEERLVYFLGVGAPTETHALEPASYYRLKRVVEQHDDMPPYVVSWNGSLFTYFFSHCWIDYRRLAADDPAKFDGDEPAVDWFENSRRAVLTHRARCIEASDEFPTFAENRWGLAPCAFRDRYLVAEVQPNLSDKDVWYDGVVAPYAAGSAIMFTPAESLARCANLQPCAAPRVSRWFGATRITAATASSIHSASTRPTATMKIWASMPALCSWPLKTLGPAWSGGCSCSILWRSKQSSACAWSRASKR